MFYPFYFNLDTSLLSAYIFINLIIISIQTYFLHSSFNYYYYPHYLLYNKNLDIKFINSNKHFILIKYSKINYKQI